MTIIRHAGATTAEALEDAVFDWVKAATGFADSQIILGEQNGPEPEGDFLTITLAPGRQRGTSLVSLIHNEAEPDPLKDMEQRSTSIAEMGVQVQAFTGDKTTGSGAAWEILSRVRDALALDSVRYPLIAVGVSVLDAGTVLRLNRVVESDFEGRASLEVLLLVRSTLSDFTGYISSASGTATVDEDATTFEVPNT